MASDVTLYSLKLDKNELFLINELMGYIEKVYQDKKNNEENSVVEYTLDMELDNIVNIGKNVEKLVDKAMED